MKVLRMIKDWFLIEVGYRLPTSVQVSPNQYWWMSRSERRRRIKEDWRG